MAGADTGILDLPYIANGAITKMRFVKLAGDQLVDQATAQGERCLGVCPTSVSADEATSGKTVRVTVLGVSWVEAAAAITRGALVAASANGRAITAASTNLVQGQALKASAAAGDLIPVLLTPVGHAAP